MAFNYLRRRERRKAMVGMTRKVTHLSVVCPAFNEEEALPRFHQELMRVLDGLGPAYEVEVLYVDDGSRDGTLLLLRRWAGNDYRVRYLSFSRNFGHQSALAAGMEHARGDVVVTMDADLQHPPSLIPVLLERWEEGYEIVVTIRRDDPTLSWFKRKSSDWFYAVMRLFSDMALRSSAADFRLMSSKAIGALGQLRESHRFLRGMVQWLGFPTAEVYFEPARRVAGTSKFNLRKMANFAIDGMVSFSRVPLRAPLCLGVCILLAGLGLGLEGLGRWLLGGEVNWAWRFLVMDMHLIGGLLLCGMGILGEYIGRVFDEVRARPIYLLKETEADLDHERPEMPPPEEKALIPTRSRTVA